jgi:anti-anti-sigma factor
MKPDNAGATPGPKSAGSRVPVGGNPLADKKPKLSLEAARLGSAVVLHCQSPMILAGESGSLCTVISDVLPSARRMVVDLAGVLSVDSGTLGELVLTQMWAEAAGYSLKFSSPSYSVRRLFESTNLISVFDVYESVDDAIVALQQEEAQSA